MYSLSARNLFLCNWSHYNKMKKLTKITLSIKCRVYISKQWLKCRIVYVCVPVSVSYHLNKYNQIYRAVSVRYLETVVYVWTCVFYILSLPHSVTIETLALIMAAIITSMSNLSVLTSWDCRWGWKKNHCLSHSLSFSCTHTPTRRRLTAKTLFLQQGRRGEIHKNVKMICAIYLFNDWWIKPLWMTSSPHFWNVLGGHTGSLTFGQSWKVGQERRLKFIALVTRAICYSVWCFLPIPMRTRSPRNPTIKQGTGQTDPFESAENGQGHWVLESSAIIWKCAGLGENDKMLEINAGRQSTTIGVQWGVFCFPLLSPAISSVIMFLILLGHQTSSL